MTTKKYAAFLALFMAVAFSLLFVGCSFDFASFGDPSVKCDETHMCSGDYFCVGGLCVPPEKGAEQAFTKGVICEKDKHCPEGFMCVNQRCEYECPEVGECPAGSYCEDGFCRGIDIDEDDGLITPDDDDDDNSTGEQECSKDDDCNLPNAIAICRAGKCAISKCLEGFDDRNKKASDGCEYKCSADAVEICNGIDDNCNGLIDEGDDLCEAGMRCYEGECVAACSQLCNDAGGSRCSSSLTYQICEYNQQADCLEWSSSMFCPDRMMCENGYCISSCSDSCEPVGAKKCVSDKTMAVCALEDDCLKWLPDKDCPKYCSGDKCVDCFKNSHCPKDNICDAATLKCLYKPDCTPSCAGKACGDDGCGGSCGTCGTNETCLNGECKCQYTPHKCDDVCCAAGEVCINYKCCPGFEAGGCDVEGAGECNPTDNKQKRECKRNSKGCLVWTAYENCPGNFTCGLKGTCGTNLCPSKDALRCGADGFSVEICKDGDGDGFLEWVFSHNCDAVCDKAKCVECKSNDDCKAPTPVCNTTTNKCLECLSSSHCPPETPICSSNKCIECAQNSDCKDETTPYCVQNNCVECQTHSQCPPTKPFCASGVCVQCNTSADCPPHAPVCSSDKKCVGCVSSSDCTASNVDRCDPNSQTCKCGSSPPCSGQTPYCVNGACRACSSDAHCPESAPFCVAGSCVECKNVSDCGDRGDECKSGKCLCGGGTSCVSPTPYCIDKRCRECKDDSYCPPSLPACIAGFCKECRIETDCPKTADTCDDNTCKCGDDPPCPTGKVCFKGDCVDCIDNSDCKDPTLPICHHPMIGESFCVECDADSHCKSNLNGAKCRLTDYKCVCYGDIDCGSERPKCNVALNMCVQCMGHDDCPFPNQRCVSRECRNCTLQNPCSCQTASDCPKMFPVCQNNFCMACDGMSNCSCGGVGGGNTYCQNTYSYYPKCVNDRCVACTTVTDCSDNIEGKVCGANDQFPNMCGCKGNGDCMTRPWPTCTEVQMPPYTINVCQ